MVQGRVTDASGLSSIITGAQVILALTPTDPLITSPSQLTTVTDKTGAYQISISGVKNVQYSGVL